MPRMAKQRIARGTRAALPPVLPCFIASPAEPLTRRRVQTLRQHPSTFRAAVSCLLACSRSASSSLLWRCNADRSSRPMQRASAVCVARRGFYAGLDESRVHRLRRSGMTFNRPRGRDTFSVAFESRLRIVPLAQMSDLYGPIDVSLITAVNADDPTSSVGNPLEQKKFMAGDAQMRRVVEKKKREEASLREKRDWHVLVVNPIELAAATAPVPFPSAHPAYYQDWSTSRGDASQRQRTSQSVLERRAVSAYGDASLPYLSYVMKHSASAAAVNAESPPENIASGAYAADKTLPPPPTRDAYFYRASSRRHLQQNGDTTLLPDTVVRQATLQLPHPDSTAAHPLPSTSHVIRQYFHTAVCVDPDIHHDRFHREEAQVEMISAYRNILYEAAELALPVNGANGGGSLRRTSATLHAAPYVADVVRVPALCHYSCGHRFLHELGKLNQQSVIKGFHRLSNEAKEALILNRCFTVEIFVPPMLLEQFEKAFLEEAWEAPTSTLNPGRTALYPGLAPPRTLLAYDGWTGKRPELLEAVETQGKSLLSGAKYGLDGKLIEEEEVLAHLRVFGTREEEQRLLEGERHTAAKQLGAPLQRTYAPLRSGLQADAANPADEPKQQ